MLLTNFNPLEKQPEKMNQKEQNILETCMAVTYDMLVGNWDHMMASMAASPHKRLSVNVTLDINAMPQAPTVNPMLSYRARAFSAALPIRAVDASQTEFRFTSSLTSSIASHENRIRRISAV